MSDRPERSAYDIVREHWMQQASGAADFEGNWRRWLHDGVIANTAFTPRTTVAAPAGTAVSATSPAASSFEVAFRNDPAVLDGRFANNGWLQELPKPITKVTWDNAVLVSPATADRLNAAAAPAMTGGEHGQIVCQVVELRHNGRTVRGPLFPVAGHPDNCATVHLGYGRTRAGRLANGAGFDAQAIRTVGDAVVCAAASRSSPPVPRFRSRAPSITI